MGAVLAAVWVKIPLWVKVALAVIIAVVLAYRAGLWIGARDERSAAKMAAIKEAANRVSTMEKNNDGFRQKSPRDRCLVIMRDSGLPDSACD